MPREVTCQRAPRCSSLGGRAIARPSLGERKKSNRCPNWETTGRNVFELVHPEDRPDVESRFAEVVRQEATSHPFELRYRHKSGSWRLIETVLSPARDPDGNEIVISNYRDVTEARYLRRQYEESERIAALGRVASSMAHEFNNVLMGIQPFVEVIKRSSDPEQLSSAANQIGASIRRGKNVTDQVLRFTRGQQKLLGPVRVLAWLGAQLPEIRAITPESIHLDLSLPDEDLWVTGNLEQLQQILVNLVSNAIQAMPEGGEMHIVAQRARQASWSFGHVPDPKSMLHLAVSDTGVGIDPELHGKIFEPLFTTGKVHGTGLGLSVTRQIITAHEGYLFVESRPGHGATFHAFIPLSTARPELRKPRGDSRLDERIRRVLLIEDEDMIAEGLRVLFEMGDVELERASTGIEGVERARSDAFDAIILDIGLPDIEGEEVFQQIRSTDSDIPIVFATGHADQQRLGELLRKPHTSFVGKPFELDSLISVLNDALRG
ncbi:MAG: response regulator [Acidobacteria bacterium]|nr:response regulator [Acidobacteriota bacterium]